MRRRLDKLEAAVVPLGIDWEAVRRFRVAMLDHLDILEMAERGDPAADAEIESLARELGILVDPR